jgi:tellurite resistance-related uncharacterized protein
MTHEPTMPADVTLVRRTAEFTDQSVPPALRRSHQIASDVWGRLRVVAGTVVFVFESEDAIAHTIAAGGHIDIPPSTPHHVEPQPGSRFYIEFHR